MKISTATSMFVNYALPDAIDQVASLGFDGIDLWCGRPHLYRNDYSTEDITHLRKRLNEINLPIVSCMPAFFRYPYSLSSPNPEIRRDSIEYMNDCLDNAVHMGASFVLVVPSNSLRGQTTENARDIFTESLGKISTHAEKNKIKLGLEVVYPRLSDYMNSTGDALQMIDNVGSDMLGIVLDSGHLNLSGEDPELALQRVSEVLLEVHVNDNDGQQQQNAIPGEGNFNFPRLFETLRRMSYQGFLCLELGWNYSFDPSPAAQRALQHVRVFINDQK